MEEMSKMTWIICIKVEKMKRRRSDINNNNISPCSSNMSSPLRRRTVVNIPVTPVRIIQDNDDSSERGVLRVQVIPPLSPSSSTLSNQSNLNLISQLSPQQIIQNMSECIKLNMAKKIDMKNAFKLEMIGYLTHMMKNKLMEPLGFQMAASSLDASAKIYSFRVDRLHLDTLKCIESLMSHERIIRDNENEYSDTERNSETDKTRRRSKNKKKKSIFTTIEALQGKVETVNYSPDIFGEIDCQTSDRLYLASLPQHCTRNCALNLYYDTIIDNFEDEEDIEENKIKWPPVKINFNLDINSEFSDFEFLNWSLEDEERLYHEYSQNYSLQNIQDDNINLVSDNNPCSPPLEVTQNHNDDYDNYGNNQSNDGDDVNDVGIGFHANEAPMLSRPCIVSDLNSSHDNQSINDEIRIDSNANNEAPELRQPCIISDLNDLMNRIPDKNLGNSSIDKSMINVLWNGPSHWKLNKLPDKTWKLNKLPDKTKNVKVIDVGGPKKKRKILLIDFEDEDIKLGKKTVNVSKKGNMKIYKQSIIENSWQTTKLLIPKKSYVNHSVELTKIYYLRLDDNSLARNDPNIIITNSDNDGVDNYNNDNDDFGPQEELVNQYQGSPRNTSWENRPTLDDNSPTNSGYNRPAQKSYLAFARRCKKLDYDRVKQQLWKILTDTDDDVDDNNNNSNDLNCQFPRAVKDLKNLNDSYLKLLNKLPKQEADFVSYSIAFVLTLQLASEKNLRVFSDNNSDVFIISEE